MAIKVNSGFAYIYISILSALLFCIHSISGELSTHDKLFLADSTDQLKDFYFDKAEADPANAYEYLLRAKALRMQFLKNPRSGEDKLQAIAVDDKITGRAKNLSLLMLADIRESAGDYALAQKLREDAGIVPQWLVAGPFGKHEAGDFFNPFEPEVKIDISAPMQGSGRQVKWLAVDRQRALNRMKPWEMVSPSRGVVYLLAMFKLSRPLDCMFNIETGCSVRAWIDGHEAAGSAVRFDRDLPRSFAIVSKSKEKFGAGWHSLVLKLQTSYLSSDFSCSLVDSTGRKIPDVEFAVLSKELPQVDNPQECVFDYGEYPKWLAERDEKFSAVEYARRGALLQAEGLYDLSLHYWQKAVESDPENAVYLSSRGSAERMCAFMPQARRDTLARRSHLNALQLAPSCVPSLLSLAEYEVERKRFMQAGKYYAQALQANPGAVRVLVSRAKMAVENNWRWEANNWLADLQQKCPECIGLPLLQARRSGKPGGLRDTARYMEKSWEENRAEVALALQAADSYFKSGLKDAASKLLGKLADWQKELPQVLAFTGKLHMADTKAGAASMEFYRASEISGGDAGYLWSAAEAAMLADNPDKVKEYLQKSLQLLPGHPQARRLLDELVGKSYAFWNEYAINGMKTLREFQSDGKPSGSTARLIDQSVMTVYPDGSYTNYTHEMQAVLTASGVSQAAVIDTYGELLQARTILPRNGLTLEPVLLPGQRNITMPALSPGVFTEHAFLAEEESAPDLTLNFPMWFFRSPENEEAFLLSQYIIRVPEGMGFSYAARNLGEEVEFEEKSDSDGFHSYIWTGRDMPRAIHEEGSPEVTTSLPLVAISGKRDWGDVNRIFLNYISGKTIPSITMRQKVASLCSEDKNITERVKSVFEFVCREVEDSSAALPASYSLEQLSGNRTILLLAMLRAADVNADFVAARDPDNIMAAPIWELPSPSVFNRFLVRARISDDKFMWLDTRFKYSVAGGIPEDLAGGSAFVVSRRGGEFFSLPVAKKYDYTVVTRRELSLTDKAVTVDGDVVLPGVAGLSLKETLVGARESQRLNAAEIILQGQKQGLELASVEYPGLEKSGQNLRLKYHGKYFGMLRHGTADETGIGGLFIHPPLLPERDNSANRETSYHLNRFVALNDTLVIKIPQDKNAVQLPQNLLIKNEIGYYQLNWSRQGDNVVAHRQCEFKPQIVKLADWKQYRQMALDIEQAEQKLIWWH